MSKNTFFVSLFERLASFRIVLWLLVAAGALLIWLVVTVPLNMAEQAVFGLATVIFALILSRFHQRFVGIMLVLLSVTVSLRYMYWRITESFVYESNLQYLLALGLLLAELYALMSLVLGYMQTIWPLKRMPSRLPDDQSDWPSVDIFIPTYNEPLKVVKPTIVGALAMHWPADKLNIYVLDDGNREEFARFCAEAGVVHFTRENNAGAKAGNINAALARTDGEFIAVFDSDHVPSRTFLKVCMGVMIKDHKMALVQLPHHFFSPDPFEHNLNLFRKVPNEGELFYGLTQPGNDFWNAAFFCGSCAVLRRLALDKVGGLAVDTVTEDAHTALRLHSLGYHSAYIRIPQAAGLATESIAAHVVQRNRWARGMAQIFRIDNPLFKRGLKMGQRLCYFNAMAHFFYGLPRIIFLTAPLAFLFFNVHVIAASAWMIAVYVLPHLIHAIMTNAKVQGEYRHSFWAEVYETLMSPYLVFPVIAALFKPRVGAFNVTSKGDKNDHNVFDQHIAMPLIIMVILNLTGACIGVWDLFMGWRDSDTLILNLIWTAYNLMILGAALAVCFESRQVRDYPRIPVIMPAMIRFSNGQTIHSQTLDISEGGLSFTLPKDVHCEIGSAVSVSLFIEHEDFSFDGVIRFSGHGRCGVLFEEMPLDQYKNLVAILFGRPNAWVHWADERLPDRPLQSLQMVMRKSVTAIVIMFSYFFSIFKKEEPK